MRTLILFIALTSLISVPAGAQFDIKKKLKDKVNRRVDRKTDEGIDKGMDETEEGIGSMFKKKKDDSSQSEPEGTSDKAAEADGESVGAGTGSATDSGPVVTLNWSKYDFVPGDKVIFEDNLTGEENGEFPSRWDLHRGNAEVAEYGGEKVIMFRDGHPAIMPYFIDPHLDHLPDVFTVEFDLYCGRTDFEVILYDRKNQKSGSPTGYTNLKIDNKSMKFGQSSSRHPNADNLPDRRWVHVSIAFTNGKLKAYMDETRLINIPRLDFDPQGITLYTYHARNDYKYFVKNVRIAEGGVKYYDRILQDGKIIANGIRFDVGKATLRPESMGIINEIYELMSDHLDLRFSIEGHTDSDGSDVSNLELSEQRARTVLNKLVAMGIDKERLSSKGLGESKPIDTNSSPEGKANNRRVEFVKI
jgi:outer membrane protein OmpA-like peptidoglycan-associated protein